MLAFERIVAFLALLTVCPGFAFADDAPPASTFYVQDTETQFSINLPKNSSDVYLYFTSPAYSWVGVGFGASMKNSLMIIMYPSQDGNNVTVSPRIANGHSEPTYAPHTELEVLPGTGVNDDMFVLQALCRSCRIWPGGAIDPNNKAQAMIYAFGPGNALRSNSPEAPLKRHVRYGKFTMDLVHATGESGVPKPNAALSGAQFEGSMVRDRDRANLAHAVIGCLALFLLWPLNVILAGFFRNIKIHVGVSVLIMVFLVIAFALGISTSSEYNRSKNFNSPHQIFAFIALFPTIVLSLLPLRPLAQFHSLIPRLHTPLASLTFTFLIITGGLGLLLSSQITAIILAYTAISLGAFVFVVLMQTCIKRRGSAYARATTRRRLGEEDEQDLVLAAYYANRKLEDESRSASAASLNRPATHTRSASSQENIYGGGTMPGPQYLLNMHPGVPVHRW